MQFYFKDYSKLYYYRSWFTNFWIKSDNFTFQFRSKYSRDWDWSLISRYIIAVIKLVFKKDIWPTEGKQFTEYLNTTWYASFKLKLLQSFIQAISSVLRADDSFSTCTGIEATPPPVLSPPPTRHCFLHLWSERFPVEEAWRTPATSTPKRPVWHRTGRGRFRFSSSSLYFAGRYFLVTLWSLLQRKSWCLKLTRYFVKWSFCVHLNSKLRFKGWGITN